MRKSVIFDLGHFNRFFNYFIKNYILIILCTLYFAGFIVGIFANQKSEEFEGRSLAELQQIISVGDSGGFFDTAFDIFFKSSLTAVAVFIVGTTAFGVVLTPIILGIKGMLYGGLAGILYCEYRLSGIAFFTLIVMPSAFILLFAYLLASIEAFTFSLMLARLTFPNSRPLNLSADFKGYCIKFFVVLLIIVFASLVNTLLCKNFLDVFKL